MTTQFRRFTTLLLTVSVLGGVVLLSAIIARAELPSVLKKQQPNICRVKARDGSKGSGCYLGAGLVLTADHVTNESTTGVVDFFGGGDYPYFVVGRSKRYDASILRIERPTERSIVGVKIGWTPTKGEVVWKAGYGRGSGKLYWHKGKVASLTSEGRIGITPYSISGDSGGPVFTASGMLIGCLQTTSVSGNRTYGNSAAITNRTLGVFTKDLLDVELSLIADRCPNGCQLGGGGLLNSQFNLFSNRGNNGDDPNNAPRAPGAIPAETQPKPDTSLVSGQFQALQQEATNAVTSAALSAEEAKTAVKELTEQIKQDKEEEEKQRLAEEEKALEEEKRLQEAKQATGIELLERWLPWVIFLVIIVYLLWKNYQQTGTVTQDDVQTAASEARPIAEPLSQEILSAVTGKTPISPVEPPKPSSPSAAARAAASRVREANAIATEEKAKAKTEIARASEDAQRDVTAIAEAAKELDA